MATSPTAAIDDRDPLNLTQKEFTAQLDKLSRDHNNLMKLAAKVYSLKKTERLSYPNGKTVGRKELRSLSSQYVKELKSLKKNYSAHGKRKKRKRTAGTSAGFKNPILVKDNMRQFFATANLGPVDPRNPSSQPLNQVLAVGREGVTTRAIMTPLFNIYAHVNNMQQDRENKQFLTSTAEMDRYFSETYQRLAAAPQRFYKPDKEGVVKPIPRFDPKHFRYASIQSIVADNAVKSAELTAEQKAGLTAPATKARLEEEQNIVSGILALYREDKKQREKAAQ